MSSLSSLPILELLAGDEIDHSHQDQAIFSNDVCYEILSYLTHDMKFIICTCSLISKQFMNVIIERVKFKLWMKGKGMDSIENSRFLNCIVKIGFKFDFIQDRKWFERIIGLMKQVTDMDVSLNRIDMMEARSISKNMNQLTLLDIGSNEIGHEGAQAISEMKLLTRLYIDYNSIGDCGAHSIGTMKQLRELTCSGNDIGVEGVRSICRIESLTNLNIGFNEIELEGVRLISGMRNLTNLNVNSCEIRFTGAELISNMKQLISLDIGQNPICYDGAKSISKMNHLTELNVYNCQLTFVGAKLIREMKLSKLDL